VSSVCALEKIFAFRELIVDWNYIHKWRREKVINAHRDHNSTVQYTNCYHHRHTRE
jgi:hypothetical protein